MTIEEKIEKLERDLAKLRMEYQEHQHTGLDVKPARGTLDFPIDITLTAANNGALSSGDAGTDLVIGNIRTRLGELITGLTNGGIIT